MRIRSFIYGFTLPIQSAKLILSHGRLLIWSLIPTVITLILYFWLIRWLGTEVQNWLQGRFLQWGWETGGWLFTVMDLVSRILLFFISALTFAFTSTLVAAPFNDHLASIAENYARPALPAVAEQDLGTTVRLMLLDMGKSIAAAIAGLCALIFSIIPIINIFAFALALLLVAFQFTSYPQTRRAWGLGSGLRFLWRHFYACLGFGLVSTLSFSIPIVSSFFLPVAVVGGTLLVARAPGSNDSTQALLKLR